MPEQLTGWKCKGCGTVHKTENLALDCEKSHEGNLEIIWKGDFQGKSYNLLIYPIYVPRTLRVQFSNRVGDSASYKLDYYGIKGI